MRHRIRGRNKCPRAPTGFLPGPSITSGLAGGVVWSDPNIDYFDLSNSPRLTFYLDVIINEGAVGLLVEAGASGDGFCAGIGSDGALYCYAGSGADTVSSDVVRTSYNIPAASRYIIEFTCGRLLSEGGVLYVNGNEVSRANDYTAETTYMAGGDDGGIARKHGWVRAMPPGCAGDISGATINDCVVWKNQFIG